MDESILHVSVDPSGPHPSIVAVGEIDVASAEPLRAAIDAQFDEGAGSVQIDVGGVTFMDSTGLGVLAVAADRAASAGGRVTVCGATSVVRRLLAVSGLDTVVEVA